ncbi:MAG: MBL fold metallo-hydrolase [Bryobacteraceae bacterium]
MKLFLLFALVAEVFDGVRITPIQHASLMIEAGGKVIYMDPAQGQYEGLPAADLILLTDTHGDHLQPGVIAKLRKAGTALMGPAAAAEKVQGMQVIRNGETRRWEGWTIEALPMYNIKRTAYHEKGRGNGYLMSYRGKRFYFAGDTENIPEMRGLRDIDAAFLPMNLPYTMTPEEAAEAARVIKPKVVYPYHYRGADLSVFQKALEGTGIEVRLRKWY